MKRYKAKNIQLLDVRTTDEYQSGHLKDAFLTDWMNQADFTKKVQLLDKSKPVYTYCLIGGRSGEAAKGLIKNGYTVYSLDEWHCCMEKSQETC
ncbi:MAG: rhodanese-like domain-containing protein [Chitinophagaceae bacterium]